MKYLILLLFSAFSLGLFAQRADSISGIKTGFICQFTYNLNFPSGDLAKRYGTGSAIGTGVYFKTGKNWTLGVEGSYWFGAKLREDSIFANLIDDQGNAVNLNGGFLTIDAQQRGFYLGAKVGKIFPVLPRNRNTGIMVSLSVGYVEHYLRLANSTETISAFNGDRRYGYDRLCAGYMTKEFIGWQHLGKRNRINFFAGVEFAQGFTQSKRRIDYDKMTGDSSPRRDNYIGLRFGWLLPIYTGNASEGDGYRFR